MESPQMVDVIDDFGLRAEPAVIAPNPFDYVHITIDLAGSGDYLRLTKDNDDEDIQSPTEDFEDLTKSFEVPIHNQFIVPLVTSLEDNTSTQSNLILTESAASETSPSMSPVVTMTSVQNTTPPTPPSTTKTSPIVTTSPTPPTTLSVTTSKITSTTTSTTTSISTTTSTSKSASTSTSTTSTSTLFGFETLPDAYSEDSETDFNWISSDYDEIEKFSNVLKIHKIPNILPVTEDPKTLFAITDVPMLKQTDLNIYQELIAAGGEKRQLFVYNHDQCISYKDGSKSSSHIIYSGPY